jgi:hypothetical protein
MKRCGKRRRTSCRSASNPSRAAFCLRVAAGDQPFTPKRLAFWITEKSQRRQTIGPRLNATLWPHGAPVCHGRLRITELTSGYVKLGLRARIRARSVHPSTTDMQRQHGQVRKVPKNEPLTRERAAREGGASGTGEVTG